VRGKRCPVCGSRRLIPVIATRPSDPPPIVGGAEPWPGELRCRVCGQKVHLTRDERDGAMWRRRRPLPNWLFRR
jgi:DNA-directed RNA polymerase subunit RPC12/RpoP